MLTKLRQMRNGVS
jgi:IS1 family transposase